ncbi:MAG: carbohydrate ABC transporter permease [Opitutales bacterium]|nr:carbohydrate ABC transporter permease [Opitutales bacterium]
MKTYKSELLFIQKVLTYILISIFSLIIIGPFIWLFCGAFKNNEDQFNFLFLPMGEGFLGIEWSRLTLEHFRLVLSGLNFGNSMMNSFFLASVISLCSTFFSAMGGYTLAKFDFRGKSLCNGIVFLSIIIPPSLLLAPVYQLLYNLGLLNSYWALLLPSMSSALGVYLFRQTCINSVPDELIYAARIDGAGEWQIFRHIVVPIIRPMVGAFLLISFLATWNNFLQPQLYLQDDIKLPLSVAISQMRGAYSTNYGAISAGTIVSVAPVMLLFLLLQKEFITGLTRGAIKG